MLKRLGKVFMKGLSQMRFEKGRILDAGAWLCPNSSPFELRISDIRKPLYESLSYLNKARSFRLPKEV